MESHVEEEEEDAILLSKPECHGRLDIEILIPFLSHIQASRSCLSFNAYNFGDGNNTGSSSASSSSSASALSLRGVSEHLEVSNMAKDDLELIYFAICANPDVNSSTTLNDLNAATTTSSQAVRIEVLKSSHNNQLLTDVTVIHGSSMSDVRQLADLLRKRPTPEKSSFGLPLVYGTRAHLWHITNHGAELLGRAISDDTTLHALDLCSCCVGTERGLEILLQPSTTNEAGQQPNSSSISNPFVSWNDFDASGCVPATKRFSQQTNSIASLYQILEGSVSSPELSGSAGLLSASIIGILISLRETHTLQQLEVQCCPSIKGNEVLGTIFDLLQVSISMEKISFNGTSLEQDGSEKHLIQSVLLDQAAKKQPPLEEGQEVSNIGPMSRRVSLSIPPLKAGCSSSCIGSGVYIDKGKSVSCGNGHQRQKCKPWEWTKTKVQAMGMGKRQRLRKEINQEEDGIDCDVEALSIAVVNVEPMTTIVPRPAKVDPIEPGSIEECMLCRDSTPEDNLFLTSCGHRFCFNCIKECVGVIIQAQMATRNLNFSSLAACPHCPITSCQSELSRSELMKLLGQKTVQAYERWLLSAYERLFGSLIQQRSENPSLLNLCSSAICDPTNPTTVLSTSFQDLFPLKEKKEGSKVFLCTSCDAAWCAFCGGQLPVIQEEHTGSGNNNDNRMHADCSGQEKFLLFKCMVELKDACQIYTQGSCQMVMNPEHTTSQKRNRISIWADGTGYGGDYNENKIQTEFMQAEAKRKEAEVDSKVASAFQFLTCILNNSHHHTGGGKRGDEEEETSCCSPITTATYVLLFGWGNTLQQLLLQLVTNDSMLDISERSNLYFKMVELLKAITTHKELFLVLAAGYNTTTTTSLKTVAKEALQHDQVILQRRTSSKSLDKVLNEDDNAFVVVNKDSTLIKKMENIYTQAKVMLQQFQSAGMSADEAAVDMDISLAKQLCVCYELMQEKEMTQGGCVTKLAPETTMHLSLEEATQSNVKRELLEPAAAHKESIHVVKNVQMNYKEKLRPLQFKQMSMVDENGIYSHHFKDHIMGKVSASSCIDRRGVHNHKRMLHLSKEIALLATTLPLEWESSIHLCVDDQRLDVLRALIIGPHATPYQNGIFLFDIFLPPDYPQVPPSVHFMTTGGGGVRFNPNLYNSGKICLSLLGTWNGPGWIPGRSTLLQVLVSIQSLIFVQNPYYNEPGYEQNMHCSEAENENMHHREHTLALAILAPLRRPDAMFADVISEHFQHKREEVEQQCQQWCAYASDINTKNRMANLMKDIKAQLQILCCSA